MRHVWGWLGWISLAFLGLGMAALVAAGQTASNPGLDAQTTALLARGLAALGTGAQAGFSASGTATLHEANGAVESGPVTVEAWGPDRCKVTIDLSLPGRDRRYQAVANGLRLHVTAPQRMLPGVVLAGPGMGCALLPASLPWAAVRGVSAGRLQLGNRLAVALDATSGLPAGAAWKYQGRSAVLSYADYQNLGGLSYPQTLQLQVDGALRLEVHWDTVAPQSGFTEADFPVPPAPVVPALKRGGGQ